MNWLKTWVRRLILREKADSERYVNYLRNKGAAIGDHVRFYDPGNTFVDDSAPWLLTIGDHVSITRGVTILTHDYGWSVVRRYPGSDGQLLGAQSPVTIGSNVFIGMQAVITRGVTIGDHVIIGAGSVVTRDCESGFVYAGNPAKKICSLEQFREKRERAQFSEAKGMARAYACRFGRKPEPEVFREYFHLFCTAEEAQRNPVFRRQMATGGNEAQCRAFLQNHPPRFSGFDAFLEACFSEETPY